MRQFDIFENPSGRSRPVIPYVVVLQSHLLNAMPTVVVAPLVRDDGRQAYSRTSAKISFRGEQFALSVAEVVATDVRQLRRAVGSLAEQEFEIRRAIDAVFTGF